MSSLEFVRPNLGRGQETDEPYYNKFMRKLFQRYSFIFETFRRLPENSTQENSTQKTQHKKTQHTKTQHTKTQHRKLNTF